MRTTLRPFETPIFSREHQSYTARALGREREDHLWEGWIEFEAADGTVLRSGRETTQPNLTDLEYWAQGLTPVYLEGALQRALQPRPAIVRETAPPAYSGPAPHLEEHLIELPEPIFDPYSVYQQGGSDLLHEELTALSAKHLRQIIRAYALADDAVVDSMDKADLMALVTRRVRAVSSARNTG